MEPETAVSAVTGAPKPPKSTLVMERFMALHIRMERMNPEKPSSVPAMISTLLPRTKPVAADETGVRIQQRHHHGHVGGADRDHQHDAENKSAAHHGVEKHLGGGVDDPGDK